MKNIFSFGGKNTFKNATSENLIQLDQSDTKSALFTVTYGRQVKSGLTYSQACTELGQCIFHYLACEGGLNNEEDI